MRAAGLVFALLCWATVGFAQNTEYAKVMNEALAESAALRSAGKLPGVPADSPGKFMLKNLPPFNSVLTYPLTITLEIESPVGQPPVSLFLLKADSSAPWAVTDQPGVKEPALRTELLALMARDQAIREDWGKRQKDPAYEAEMVAVDTANTIRIKAIVAQYGWPGNALVGTDGALAAFLLVQHADLDRAFQKDMLVLLEAAYRSGQASGPDYALLVDRVRIGEGRLQLYGSQCQPAPDGASWVPCPIEQSDQVDARRKEVGLMPLAEYLELLNHQQSLKSN